MSELRTRIEALRRLERSVLVEEKLDKAVVQGWRKSWRILVKEYRQAVKARGFKKAFSALDAMGRWVENLRRDLLFKRGLSIASTPVKKKARKNYAVDRWMAKTFDRLKHVEDIIGRVKQSLSEALWFNFVWGKLGGTEVDSSESQKALYGDVATQASEFVSSQGGSVSHFINPVDQIRDALSFYRSGVQKKGSAQAVFDGWIDELADPNQYDMNEIESGIKKVLSGLTAMVREVSPSGLDLPERPEEARVGNMSVLFRDVTDPAIRNWGNVDPEAGPYQSWGGTSRVALLQAIKKAYNILKAFGVANRLWYGVIFVENPAGYDRAKDRSTGAYGNAVGGYYRIPGGYENTRGDTITFYPDENPRYIPELILHELAHRAWYKVLGGADRRKFENEYFDVAKRVSSYAKNNPSEAFAELMSLYWAGKVKEKGLIDLAKRYNRKLGGR